MKTRWFLIFILFLTLGAIGHANVVTAAGDVCVSTNGNDPSQPDAFGKCLTEDSGDVAINIQGGGTFVFAGGGPENPSRAIGRNGGNADARANSLAQATNKSNASAFRDSTAHADDSSYASADNNSYAEATNDSSAIARTNSTAIATDGGCAYASGNSTAEAGSGEIVVVIDNVLRNVTEVNVNTYCSVWPPGGGWPFP